MWDDSVGKLKSKRNRQNKPYERPKSLLRRVTDSVTGLLPQPAWLSSWLKSDKLEENDEATEREGGVFPPKAAKLTGKATLNSTTNSFSQESFIYSRPAYAQPTPAQRGTENQPNGNATLDDSLPGPSGLHLSQHPMASTPAPTPEKSGPGPAVAKEDESNSESTSGCSSLVPHPDRKDPQTSLSRPGPGSALNVDDPIARNSASQVSKSSASVNRSKTGRGALSKGRKCLNLPGSSNAVLATSETTQEPEESIQEPIEKQSSMLVMDRSTSYIEPQASALSSKRPRFSISAFGSPPQAKEGVSAISSILHSPFYAGKTTYGGASAYRRARLNVSTPYNVSQRQQVQVKSKGPVVLSNTAQRILEALESMSTPIRDAKKIPTPAKATSFSTRLSETNKSVAADDTFTGFGAGLLSWSQRRRPKLSTTAPAATPAGPPVGKLATTTPVRVEKLPAAPLPTEFSHFGSSAAGGKMRAKVTAPVRESLASRTEAAEEEEAAIPDLPNIPLPIKSLPTFSLPFAPFTTATTTAAVAPPSTAGSNIVPVSIKSKFTFSAPIKEAECPPVATPSVKIGFKFSAPISALDQNGVSTSLPSKEIQFKVTETPKATTGKRVSFGITEDDEVTPSKGTWTAKDLVSGSVMDILGSKKSTSGFGDAFKPKADTWECTACLVRSDSSKDKCVACETTKPGASTAFTATKPFTFSTPTTVPLKSAITAPLAASTPFAGFGNQFKPPADQWECSACMIRNKKDASRCAACETPKPGANKAEPAAPVSTPKPFSGFGDKFKPPADQWECSVCMVRNKSEASKCVACETPKPGAAKPEPNVTKTSAPTSTGGFGDKFKPAADTWECNVCMVRNKSIAIACVSCESPKPGSLPSTPAAPFKFGVKSAETSGFKFGVPSVSSASSTTSTTETSSGFKFGVTAPASTATSTPPAGGFKFGVPAADTAEKKPTETAAPAFKFGIPSTEEVPKSSAGSTEAESAGPAFTFGAGKPFVPKLKASEAGVEAASPLKPPTELKLGSVMDILGGKKTVDTTAGVAATTTAPVSAVAVATPSFSFGHNKPADAPAPAFSFGLAAAPSTTTSVPPPAQTPSFSFGAAATKPAESTVAGGTASFTFTGAKRSVDETGSEEPAKKTFAFGQTPTAPTTTPSLGAGAPSLAFPSVPAATKPSETATTTSTTGSLFSFGTAAPAAPTSTTAFSFGAPAAAPVASTQSTTTPVFTFGAKDGGIKPGTGFGAPSATTTTQSTLPPFGTTPAFGKPAEVATTTAATFSFGAATSVTTTVSSNAIFSFGSTAASGATPTPGFGFGAPAPSAAPTTTATTTAPFGSTGFGGFGTAAPSSTSATTPSTLGFGFSAPASTSSGLSGFGAPKPATTTNPPPPYGGFGTSAVTSTATAPTFGGFGTPAATTAEVPAFGGFGIPPAMTTTPAPAFGGFGAPVATTPAPIPAVVGFGAPVTTTTALATTPIFSFGASTKPAFGVSPAPSPVFGATPGGQASSGLTFGSAGPSAAPLGGGLTFGATPATTTASTGGFSFGTPQAAPTFSSTPSFSFGQSQTQPAAPAGGVFHFGGQPSAAPAHGGFAFGGASTPAAAPAPSQGGFAFNPSAPPSFAFGGGATPATPNFSANPFDATGAGSGARRIRKAARRTGR